jgi:hypothetical protein
LEAKKALPVRLHVQRDVLPFTGHLEPGFTSAFEASGSSSCVASSAGAESTNGSGSDYGGGILSY